MAQDTVSAVVLAAGRGVRLGAERNKVFLEVAARPLLWYALSALGAEPAIGDVVVVVRAGEEEAAQGVLTSIPREVRIVCGGERRQDSALAGVEAARGRIVLVQDGARPFPSRDLILRVIDGVRRHGACVPVVPTVGTLRYADGEGFLQEGSVDRRGLLEMQTPQGFERNVLLRSLRAAERELTDDAEALLSLGRKVFTVCGEATNLKVTNKDDLLLAEAIARALLGRAGGLPSAERERPSRRGLAPGEE